MSLKTKTFRIVALGVFSTPAILMATEPRIIVPTTAPTKVVFERDNETYEVLNRFRNARSSEQIHFQAIETLFPRVPDRESVREGYSMVKEIVDAKKAAIQAAAELEAERARLEAARVDLETQAQVAQQAQEQTWDAEPEEFDYYEFDEALKQQVESEPIRNQVHKHSAHNNRARSNANSNKHRTAQKRSWFTKRNRGGRGVRR